MSKSVTLWPLPDINLVEATKWQIADIIDWTIWTTTPRLFVISAWTGLGQSGILDACTMPLIQSGKFVRWGGQIRELKFSKVGCEFCSENINVTPWPLLKIVDCTVYQCHICIIIYSVVWQAIDRIEMQFIQCNASTAFININKRRTLFINRTKY